MRDVMHTLYSELPRMDASVVALSLTRLLRRADLKQDGIYLDTILKILEGCPARYTPELASRLESAIPDAYDTAIISRCIALHAQVFGATDRWIPRLLYNVAQKYFSRGNIERKGRNVRCHDYRTAKTYCEMLMDRLALTLDPQYPHLSGILRMYGELMQQLAILEKDKTGKKK